MTSISEKRSFSPLAISGCKMWLDAADTSTFIMNGSNISSWIDKTGNGFNVTQASAGSQPTRDANSVVFGYSSTLEFSGSVGIHQNSYTAYMIYKCQIVEQGINLLDCRDSTTGYMFVNIQFFSWTASSAAYSRAWTPTQSITILGFNNTPAFIYNKSVNGSSFSPGGDGWSPNAAASYFRIGGFPGNIYECLLYTRSVTSTEHNQITGYLAWKWGVQNLLPGAHPNYSLNEFSSPPFPSFAIPTTSFKTRIISALFSPLSIAGCQLWLDGSDTTSLTISSGAITQWRDKSGSSNHFAQTSGTPSSISDNGRSVVNFTSGAIMTSVNQITFTGSSAFFIVSRLNLVNASNAGMLLDFTYMNGYKSIRFFGPIGILGGTPATFGDEYELANGAYYVNGTFNPSFGSSTYLNVYSIICTVAPSSGGTSYLAFSSSFYERYFIGNIAEFLYYPGGITSRQRQQVEGYLAWKWGIQSSLPGSHPNFSVNEISAPFPSFAIPTTPFKLQRAPFVDPTAKYSALFNRANNTSLSIPENSVFTLGTNNHTIEFWLYQTSRDTYDVVFSYGNPSLFGASTYFMSIGSYIGIVVGNGAGNWAVNMGGTVSPLPALNTWHHYAVVRNGTTFTLYINGISRESATSSFNIAAQGNVFRIGNTTTYPTEGYMTNFRFVNGTAVYTSNFTPPTSPLTAIPNTQILLQGITDRSSNAFTLTNNGGVTLSTTVSPFA